MPKFSRKTSHVEARRPLGVYDGPEPPRGNYQGTVQSVTFRTYDSGWQCFNVLVVLEAPEDSPKAQYNGFNVWTRIGLGESDMEVARENAFYLAMSGRSDVDVVIAPAEGKKDPKVTKIGANSKLIGTKVRVDVQYEEFPQGSGKFSPRGDTIYAIPGAANAAPAANEDPDADPDADAEVASEPVVEKPKRTRRTKAQIEADEAAKEPEETTGEVEITGATESTEKAAATEADPDPGSMSLPRLKAYAKDLGIDITGKNKATLLAEIESSSEADPADPTAAEVEEWDDEKFWALAKEVYAEDIDPGSDDRAEVLEMLLEDGRVKAF